MLKSLESAKRLRHLNIFNCTFIPNYNKAVPTKATIVWILQIKGKSLGLYQSLARCLVEEPYCTWSYQKYLCSSLLQNNKTIILEIFRYGTDAQKMAFMNSKNSYYKNQIVGAANNYKVNAV